MTVIGTYFHIWGPRNTAHKQVPSGATFLNFEPSTPISRLGSLEDFKSRFLTNKHYTRWTIDIGYMLNKGKGRFCTFYSFSILLFDPGLKYRFCRHLNKIGRLGIELASGLCNPNDNINKAVGNILTTFWA